jgi:hypothetical protein
MTNVLGLLITGDIRIPAATSYVSVVTSTVDGTVYSNVSELGIDHHIEMRYPSNTIPYGTDQVPVPIRLFFTPNSPDNALWDDLIAGEAPPYKLQSFVNDTDPITSLSNAGVYKVWHAQELYSNAVVGLPGSIITNEWGWNISDEANVEVWPTNRHAMQLTEAAYAGTNVYFRGDWNPLNHTNNQWWWAFWATNPIVYPKLVQPETEAITNSSATAVISGFRTRDSDLIVNNWQLRATTQDTESVSLGGTNAITLSKQWIQITNITMSGLSTNSKGSFAVEYKGHRMYNRVIHHENPVTLGFEDYRWWSVKMDELQRLFNPLTNTYSVVGMFPGVAYTWTGTSYEASVLVTQEVWGVTPYAWASRQFLTNYMSDPPEGEWVYHAEAAYGQLSCFANLNSASLSGLSGKAKVYAFGTTPSYHTNMTWDAGSSGLTEGQWTQSHTFDVDESGGTTIDFSYPGGAPAADNKGWAMTVPNQGAIINWTYRYRD